MDDDSRGDAGVDMLGRTWLVHKFGGGGESNYEAFEMTPDDYLAIISVGLPMVTMAMAAVMIVMKQEWRIKKGEG